MSQALLELLNSLLEHGNLLFLQPLVLGHLFGHALVFETQVVGLLGLCHDFLLHGLEGVHEFFYFALAGELLIGLAPQQLDALPQIVDEDAAYC